MGIMMRVISPYILHFSDEAPAYRKLLWLTYCVQVEGMSWKRIAGQVGSSKVMSERLFGDDYFIKRRLKCISVSSRYTKKTSYKITVMYMQN